MRSYSNFFFKSSHKNLKQIQSHEYAILPCVCHKNHHHHHWHIIVLLIINQASIKCDFTTKHKKIQQNCLQAHIPRFLNLTKLYVNSILTHVEEHILHNMHLHSAYLLKVKHNYIRGSAAVNCGA